MVTMPVLTGLKVAGYGLFPGDPTGAGIDQPFRPGLTLIAGINGLGKTTLLTAILRGLTGPYDLTGEGAPVEMSVSMPESPVKLRPKPISFFKQRVADNAEKASFTLTATFGPKRLLVERAMSDLSLTRLEVDEEPALSGRNREEREESFQAKLMELMELGSFTDVLLVLHHVMLFQENRPGALWDENAQRQVLRALFLDKDDAVRVAHLEREVQSADSQARGINARITATEEDLKKAKKLEAGSEAAAAQLEAEQKLLDADLIEKARIDEKLIAFEEQRRSVRLQHEKAKISREEASGAVERIKYSALANLYPDMDQASRLVIARILTQSKCLVCDAGAAGKREELEALLAKGICPACGAPPEEQHNVIGKYKFEQAKLDAAVATAKLAETEVVAKASELGQIRASYERALNRSIALKEAIDDRKATNRRLRAELPDGVTSKEIEGALTTLRRQQAEFLAKLAEHARDLSELLTSKEELISSRAAEVMLNFSELTETLLAEPARLTEVKLRPRYTQAPGATGPNRLSFPAYKAEMVAANRPGFVRRDDPSDVSESQRELIDLAFRLSLVRVAAPDATATFVMETPEASLDGVAMMRVGKALAEFAAESDNRLIVTSNLSNAGLITGLFGGPSPSDAETEARRKRVLNLLKVAAPTRHDEQLALGEHQSAPEARQVVRHGGPAAQHLVQGGDQPFAVEPGVHRQSRSRHTRSPRPARTISAAARVNPSVRSSQRS